MSRQRYNILDTDHAFSFFEGYECRFVADINLGPRQEITPLNPYPGTALYENAHELGMKFIAEDWSDYDHPIFSVVETRECSKSDMVGIWTYIAKKLITPSPSLKKEE